MSPQNHKEASAADEADSEHAEETPLSSPRVRLFASHFGDTLTCRAITPYAVSSWDASVLQLLLTVNVLQTEKRQAPRTPSVSPPEDEQGQEPQVGRQGARVSAAPPRKVLPPADPPLICSAVAGRRWS